MMLKTSSTQRCCGSIW